MYRMREPKRLAVHDAYVVREEGGEQHRIGTGAGIGTRIYSTLVFSTFTSR